MAMRRSVIQDADDRTLDLRLLIDRSLEDDVVDAHEARQLQVQIHALEPVVRRAHRSQREAISMLRYAGVVHTISREFGPDDDDPDDGCRAA